MQLRVACAQMDVIFGDKDANMGAVVQMANMAADKQADLLVLPELFTTGFCLNQANLLAEKPLGHSVQLLRDLASRFRLLLVGGSILERRGDKIYNTCPIIGKDGKLLGTYDKIHLFPPFVEDKYLTPGGKLNTIKTSYGQFGVMICFDIRFPETARSLALQGAQVIFCPAEFPAERINVWATLLRARAIENQVFVVGCNRVGSDGKNIFGGRSAIIDPEGKTLAQADDSAQLIDAVIDLDQIAAVKEQLPFTKYRRKDLYKS
ncbi:MAG: carbon-nitrogen family hydrolase [Promethearchaeota archaeon]